MLLRLWQWSARPACGALDRGYSAQLGTKRVSDQLSDYGVVDRYTRAHNHACSYARTGDLDRAPTVLRDEEVAGSNPVTPTTIGPSQPPFQQDQPGRVL
jgi:hypothetical protein